MLEGHQALSLVASDVVQFDALVHAEGDDEPSSTLVGIALILVNMAPSEVTHSAVVIIQAEDVLPRLGRPYQHVRIIGRVTRQKMASGVPLDAFNATLMALPQLFRISGHVNGPEIYFITARSRQLSVILPGDVHDGARLSELVHGVLLDGVGVPDEHVGLHAA